MRQIRQHNYQNTHTGRQLSAWPSFDSGWLRGWNNNCSSSSNSSTSHWGPNQLCGSPNGARKCNGRKWGFANNHDTHMARDPKIRRTTIKPENPAPKNRPQNDPPGFFAQIECVPGISCNTVGMSIVNLRGVEMGWIFRYEVHIAHLCPANAEASFCEQQQEFHIVE